MVRVYWFLCLLVSLALLPSLGFAQSVVSGDTVQTQLNAAIDGGQNSFQLPNATIQLTKSFTIPARARNFTVFGQSRTKFVRSVSSDFPLLVVGSNESGVYSNTELLRYPQFPVLPASDGATTLTVPPGTVVPPGYYVIAGMDPVNDIVRLNATSTYNYKREMVRVLAQNGNSLVLEDPLAREYGSPALFQIELANCPVQQRQLVSNVQLVNFAVDGRLGDITTGRAAVTKAPQASKVVVLSFGNFVTFDNVRISGFTTSGLSILLSRWVTVRNSIVYDGNVRVLGYGIEVGGSRNTNILSCTFQDVRHGIEFWAGSTDGYVSDCTIPPGRGSFNPSHGHDERRILFNNCKADSFVIGNSGWQRGCKDIRIFNSSAYQNIVIYGSTQNIQIMGTHPTLTYTAPKLQLFTTNNVDGFPTGPVWPMSVRCDFASFNNSFSTGQCIEFGGDTMSQPRLGSVIFNQCYLTNGVFNGGGVLDFGNLAGTGTLQFDDCTLTNSNAAFAPLMGQNNAAGGNWAVTFNRCSMFGPSTSVMQLLAGARGSFTFQSSKHNFVPIQSSMIQNQSGGTATTTILP